MLYFLDLLNTWKQYAQCVGIFHIPTDKVFNNALNPTASLTLLLFQSNPELPPFYTSYYLGFS